MEYLVFEGRSYKEALDQMYVVGAKKNLLPQMQIVKKVEEEKRTFFGLRKNKNYKVIVSICEYVMPKKNKKNRVNKFSPGTPDLFNANNSTSRPDLPEISGPRFSNKNIKSFSNESANVSEENIKLKEDVSSLKESMEKLEVMIIDQMNDMKSKMIRNQISDKINMENNIIEDVEISTQNIKWAKNFLRDKEFSEFLINDMVEYLKTLKKDILIEKSRILMSIREFLKQNIISEEISTDDYNHGRIILLAGPTGVGKTITIVKMAAHIAAMRQKTMRFISVDRYKVGADSQLKTYANLMQSSFYPIHKEKEFYDLFNKNESDFTFIDTAGKSPKNTIAIKDLSDWIKKCKRKIDIHLVISCGTKSSDLELITDQYSMINFDHIIATKMDETTSLGSILSIIYKIKKPLSFVTNGQEVPQDLEIANVDKIINESIN